MSESEDIVTRLRAVLHNDRSVELMNREAADEIERLRHQLWLANIDNFNTITEAERLCDERDEARRMVCGLDADIMEDQIEYAKHRNWDCFGVQNAQPSDEARKETTRETP